jgi:hypothetical protein
MRQGAGIWSEAALTAASRATGIIQVEMPPVSVIVAGWPAKELNDLVEGFVGFAPPDSQVRCHYNVAKC